MAAATIMHNIIIIGVGSYRLTMKERNGGEQDAV